MCCFVHVGFVFLRFYSCSIAVFDVHSSTSILLRTNPNTMANTAPSYVYVHPATGKMYCGDDALIEAGKPGSVPENLLHSFKRVIGKRYVVVDRCCRWCSVNNL